MEEGRAGEGSEVRWEVQRDGRRGKRAEGIAEEECQRGLESDERPARFQGASVSGEESGGEM